MDKNQITLIGNLGEDPHHFNDPDKTEFATFSVATTLQFKTATGEIKQETEWHRVVAFGVRAAIASQFQRGERVYVEGFLRTRKYDKSGTEETIKEVVAQVLFAVRMSPHPESTRDTVLAQDSPAGAASKDPAASLRQFEGALY